MEKELHTRFETIETQLQDIGEKAESAFSTPPTSLQALIEARDQMHSIQLECEALSSNKKVVRNALGRATAVVDKTWQDHVLDAAPRLATVAAGTVVGIVAYEGVRIGVNKIREGRKPLPVEVVSES